MPAGRPRKYFSEEERKAGVKEAQRKWRERNADYVAAYYRVVQRTARSNMRKWVQAIPGLSEEIEEQRTRRKQAVLAELERGKENVPPSSPEEPPRKRGRPLGLKNVPAVPAA